MTTLPSAALRQACTAQATIETPLGRVLLARTARGLAGAWFEDQKYFPGTLDAPERADDPLLQQAARELLAHLAGGRRGFAVPLDPVGTPFQRAVWQAMAAIPPGATCSYRDLAQRVGRPAAVRAVGAAVGRNPLLVIVPCHRVIGSDGSLTGYAGGLDRKRALLALEHDAEAA